MIVSQPTQLLWAWLNTRIGTPWSSDFRAIGAVKDDCLKAVIGYNGFTGRVCFMHNAIEDPSVITRTFVREVFWYPFVQCGLVQVLAPVAEDNEKAMSLNLRVGFKPLITLPGTTCEGKDIVLLSMKREECRWIKEKYNGWKEKPSAAGLCGRSSAAGRGQQRTDDSADMGQPPGAEHALGQPDLERVGSN